MKKIKIEEHLGYYFAYDPEDSSIPVTVYSNWRKTGKTPAVIDETYSRPLKSADDRPRLYVTIATMNKKVRVYLNTLVASYLIPNPNNYERVIHKDNNIYNCHPDNLQWATEEEYKTFTIGIDQLKGRTKQFVATYKDGSTEIVTGFLEFLKRKNIPEQALYRLRKGEISEYKGIVSFEEIGRDPKYRDQKKPPTDFNFDGYDTVELDDWPGYYIVYKEHDVNEPIRIFSKWDRVKEEMVLCDHFIRESSLHIHKTGYYQVNMKLPGEKKIIKKLHRLVAKQLVHNPNPEEYLTVDHIDSNKLNNHPSNLQWLSNSLNVKKAFDDGIHTRVKFEIIFEDGRVEIVENLTKFCREEKYNQSGCYNLINKKQPKYRDIIKITKIEL
jgi:predicted transcriptional regulator